MPLCPLPPSSCAGHTCRSTCALPGLNSRIRLLVVGLLAYVGLPQVPAWRGRTNVELMLDPNTRCALECLLDECAAEDKGLNRLEL